MGIEPTAPSDPGAGADLVITIATGKTVLLRSLAFQFLTSAAVANRVVRVQIDDGSGLNLYWFGENNVAQTAGIQGYYSFALGYEPPAGTAIATTQYRAFCLPPIVLKAGWRISTAIEAIDANDAISSVRYQLQDVNAQTVNF